MLVPRGEGAVGADTKHIALASAAQRHLDVADTIDTVGDHLGKRSIGSWSALDHGARECRFRGEADGFGHKSLGPLFGVICPYLRQIERPVDKSVPVTRDTGCKNAYLAIGDLACRSDILTRYTAGSMALLQKSYLINDQYHIGIRQRLQCMITHDVMQGIGVPLPATEYGLLTPRAMITSGYRPHPTRLSALIPQQTIQKMASRCRNPFLDEQRPHPPFHIPKV